MLEQSGVKNDVVFLKSGGALDKIGHRWEWLRMDGGEGEA